MSIIAFLNSLHMPELTVSQDIIDNKINAYQAKLKAMGFETTTEAEATFTNLVLTKTLRAKKNHLLVCLRLDQTGYEDLSISLERAAFTYRLPNFYKNADDFFAALEDLDHLEATAA
ncbi:MAG: hypothetical protein E6713_03950 [Sporomusaceae bacterium]|nr:hypothetical protein [Sporomusaceae bacterium]